MSTAFADLSLRSISAITVPDGKAVDSLPDFVVGHFYTEEQDEPEDNHRRFRWSRRLGLKFQHQCFPIIAEIKEPPSRQRRARKLAREVKKRLAKAEQDLLYYLALYFTRDTSAQAVIAISGAGLYWRWREFQREEVPSLTFATVHEVYHEYTGEDAVRAAKFMRNFNTRDFFYLGRPQSDKELTRMRETALIPLLKKHNNYPFTMLPNPPPRRKHKGPGEDGDNDNEDSDSDSEHGDSEKEDSDDENDDEGGKFQDRSDTESEGDDDGGEEEDDDDD